MFNGGYAPSLADIAAVSNRNNNDGFGGGWWAWILMAVLFGWGGFGFGGFGGFGMGGWGNGANAAFATQADIQRGFDTNNILGSLRGIEQGICNLGYDQLAQMNGINTNIMQNGYETRNAITQQTIADIQSTNALSSQFAQCRCDQREATAQLRYDMATDTCAITTAIKDATNAQMQNCNANYRALEQRLDRMEMSAKDQKIADLQVQLNRCDRDSALLALGNSVVERITPRAVPAFQVPNPYTGSYYNGYGNYYNGYGNNCPCSYGC